MKEYQMTEDMAQHQLGHEEEDMAQHQLGHEGIQDDRRHGTTSTRTGHEEDMAQYN